MAELHISDTLSLPLDMVVQQSAILARTGAGKTNAATVIVEELLSHGQQVVIVDPPGAWWGLRASADGSDAGHPIAVIGGEHGDAPLPSDSGKLLADIVVDERLSAILDLSDLSGRQIAAFVLAFATRLYERKGRERSPLLLVIEEADEVAPQRAMPDQTRMLGAVERIVKRGRMRGIGTLMISQRSASLNKNVLSQAELLIAMQTTAPQDIKAIDAWTEHHGDQEQRQQLLGAIATLDKGEAFIWSPSWLRTFQRIRFRLRHTFDSSATPKPGEVREEPAVLADIDLERLRKALGAAVNEPADTDAGGSVRDLRRALAEQRKLLDERDAYVQALETELRHLRVQLGERPSVEYELVNRAAEVEVRLNSISRNLREAMDSAGDALTAATLVSRALRAIRDGASADGGEAAPASSATAAPTDAPPAASKLRVLPQRPQEPRRPAESGDRPKISGPGQRVLNALATYESFGERAPSRAAVGAVAGYKQSGHFDNTLGSLRLIGLIEYPTAGHLTLTDCGRQFAEGQEFASVAEVHRVWMALCSRSQQRVLAALIDAYPADRSRSQLAAAIGMTESGHFDNLVGSLRTMGAVEYPKPRHVLASALLFPEGLR